MDIVGHAGFGDCEQEAARNVRVAALVEKLLVAHRSLGRRIWFLRNVGACLESISLQCRLKIRKKYIYKR